MEHFLFHLLFFGCFEPVLGGRVSTCATYQLGPGMRGFSLCFFPLLSYPAPSWYWLLSYQSGLVLVLGASHFFSVPKWQVYRTGIETGIKLVLGWYYLKYLQDWYLYWGRYELLQLMPDQWWYHSETYVPDQHWFEPVLDGYQLLNLPAWNWNCACVFLPHYQHVTCIASL